MQTSNTPPTTSQTPLTFRQATKILRQFINDRQWDKYHTPRNLIMALVGEVGEIAQIFQWKGEVQVGLTSFSAQQKIHVGQQISDVLCYLIRLADVSGIDIETAFKNKLIKNNLKYPINQIKSNSNLIFQIKQQRRIKRQQNNTIKQIQNLKQNQI